MSETSSRRRTCSGFWLYVWGLSGVVCLLKSRGRQVSGHVCLLYVRGETSERGKSCGVCLVSSSEFCRWRHVAEHTSPGGVWRLSAMICGVRRAAPGRLSVSVLRMSVVSHRKTRASSSEVWQLRGLADIQTDRQQHTLSGSQRLFAVALSSPRL